MIISISLLGGAVSFAAENSSLSAQPTSTLKSMMPLSNDTLNVSTLKKLQDIKIAKQPTISEQNSTSYGGGYGGNEQTSMLVYDGLPHHLAAFPLKRDDKKKLCYMENQDAGIYHYNFFGYLKLTSYSCPSTNKYHNQIYWNERLDIRNGAYSIDNDALYAGTMVNKMYMEWFGISATQNVDGGPAPIQIVTHVSKLPDAQQRGNQIILGDGDKNLYPFSSPGIISFMMGFIFTEQHSQLDYNYPTSAGISLAFNAMADQAVKFYITGQNDWQIGNEISKSGQPLYFMDQPSRDCGSRKPGDNCSIDHMSQYKSSIDSHFTSGVYRRALYLLATTPDWDVKKTFGVMVQANRFYWTSKQSFTQGVCGMIKAARDLQYDTTAIIDAFDQVGIISKNC